MNQQAVINTAHSVLSKSTAVLYDPAHTLFDFLIKDTNSTIFNNTDIVQNYYYDFYFSNKIFSINNIRSFIFINHLKHIIGIHSDPPASFKKEDLYIFHDNTKYFTRIFFGQNLADSWRAGQSENNIIIDYGVPETISNVERTIPVLILNLENNPQIDNLYRFIQSHIKESIMIKNISSGISIQEVIDMISKSKIFIDNSSRINILFALACGCQTISSFKDIKSSFNNYIEDYSTVVPLINQLLDNNNDPSIIKNEATKNYPYNEFLDKLNLVLNGNLKSKEMFKL
jgi:hypothetical protein